MHKDLVRLDSELTRALAGLTAAQTQSTPLTYPDKWSIQQIVEHLLITYRGTVSAIQARVDKRTPTRATPTFRQHLFQFAIFRLGLYPSGRPAPTAVTPSRPASLRSGDELLTLIRTQLAEIDRVTTAGEPLFGTRPAVSHLVLGPLSMERWRRFHLRHGHHHVLQITAIRLDHSL